MVEKTSTYIEYGSLIIIILLGGSGLYLMPTSSYDLCTSNGNWSNWEETDINFKYYCSPEDTYQYCWDIHDYGDNTDSKCLKLENVGEFTTYTNNQTVGIRDSILDIAFTPETIICSPYGSNGNFVSRCKFDIKITDKMNDSACLELPLMYFKDVSNNQTMDTHFDYGHENEGILINNKICNVNHSRTIKGYFDTELGSSGKFDAYFPFLGINYIIDPYWETGVSYLFEDDFDRADDPDIGNDWIEWPSYTTRSALVSDKVVFSATTYIKHLVPTNVNTEFQASLYFTQAGRVHAIGWRDSTTTTPIPYGLLVRDGDNTICIGDATFSCISSTDTFSPSTGTWYLVKILVNKSGIYGKIWEDGTSEPGWLVSYGTPPSATYNYIQLYSDSTNAYFDNVYVTDVDGLSFNGTFNNTVLSENNVILAGNNLTGSYISNVFDAESEQSWDSISWETNYDTNSTFDLNVSYRSCDDDACSGESWIAGPETDLNSTTAANNQYFQYKFDFLSSLAGSSPILSSVDVGYESTFVPSWIYKQPINITTASGSTNTDFPVEIILNSSNTREHFDFSEVCNNEIRFTDDSDNQLSYWTANCDDVANTSRVFVKIPDGVTTSITTIYMLYGAPGADPGANGDDVFTFFDDFNGTSLDTSKWTASSADNIQSLTGDGRLNVTFSGISWTNGMTSTTSFANSNYLTEFSFEPYANTGNNQIIMGLRSDSTNYAYNSGLYQIYISSTTVYAYEGGSSTNFGITHTNGNNYYYKIEKKSTGGATYYRSTDGYSWISYRDMNTGTSTSRTGFTQDNKAFYSDYWMVRDYHTSAINFVFGDEEEDIPTGELIVNILNNSFSTNDTTPTIYYNLTSNYSTANCTLYMNDVARGTSINVDTSLSSISITSNTSLSPDVYVANISCYDVFYGSDSINVTILEGPEGNLSDVSITALPSRKTLGDLFNLTYTYTCSNYECNDIYREIQVPTNCYNLSSVLKYNATIQPGTYYESVEFNCTVIGDYVFNLTVNNTNGYTLNDTGNISIVEASTGGSICAVEADAIAINSSSILISSAVSSELGGFDSLGCNYDCYYSNGSSIDNGVMDNLGLGKYYKIITISSPGLCFIYDSSDMCKQDSVTWAYISGGSSAEVNKTEIADCVWNEQGSGCYNNKFIDN